MAEELIDRNNEMKRLRFEEGLSTSEIGRRHGISRERVAQIVGRNGVDFRRKWTENLKQSGIFKPMSVSEVDSLPGLKSVWLRDWGMERHPAKKGSYLYRSQQNDQFASDILVEAGIPNSLMGSTCDYSIITDNGARIEVRCGTTDVSRYESQPKCLYPTYRIPNINPTKKFDYLIAFVPEYDESLTYFVIPHFELMNLKPGYRNSIRIPWPPTSQKPSKWHKYHNRIDLIKEH